MKAVQEIHCPKCLQTSNMFFEMESETSTVCPECGQKLDLIYYCPLSMMQGKWLVVIEQGDLAKYNVTTAKR